MRNTFIYYIVYIEIKPFGIVRIARCVIVFKYIRYRVILNVIKKIENSILCDTNTSVERNTKFQPNRICVDTQKTTI